MRLRRPRSRLEWAGAVLVALVIGGALFVWVAPYNIAARIPHAPGVSWLLHTYMRSAVKTWSLGAEPPSWVDLDSPALVRLGAGHFETGCAPCHGAPGRPPNPLTRGMRPQPPALEHAVGRYDAGDLHWLVWNGLKYTGMPAWAGAHREDEPWALAAFLLRYDGLTPEAYAELAYGGTTPDRPLGAAVSVSFGRPDGTLDRVRANCARCHGEDGLGRQGTAPKLAGQSEPYLRASLAAYANGRRQSGFMEPVAAALTPEQRAELAAYFASLPPFGGDAADGEDELVRLGARLAGRGSETVPSCRSCHGDAMNPPRKPIYPRIAGQPRRFLIGWLNAWQKRDIGGTDHSHLMHVAAERLSDREIAALATYFAAGAPPRARSPDDD